MRVSERLPHTSKYFERLLTKVGGPNDLSESFRNTEQPSGTLRESEAFTEILRGYERLQEAPGRLLETLRDS